MNHSQENHANDVLLEKKIKLEEQIDRAHLDLLNLNHQVLVTMFFEKGQFFNYFFELTMDFDKIRKLEQHIEDLETELDTLLMILDDDY